MELALEKEQGTEGRIIKTQGMVWSLGNKVRFPDGDPQFLPAMEMGNGCVGVCGRQTLTHSLQVLQSGEKAGPSEQGNGNQCSLLSRVSATVLTWNFPRSHRKE